MRQVGARMGCRGRVSVSNRQHQGTSRFRPAPGPSHSSSGSTPHRGHGGGKAGEGGANVVISPGKRAALFRNVELMIGPMSGMVRVKQCAWALISLVLLPTEALCM